MSRALATHGHATAAVLPLSASSEAVFRAMIGTSTPIEPVMIRGDMRVNISLVEDGRHGHEGQRAWRRARSGRDRHALLERASGLAAHAAWVAAAGSLPPGSAPDLYRRLAGVLPSGVRLAVDADGAALRACSGEQLALIKPNLEELETLMGRRLPTLGDVAVAGRELVEGGIDAVLVSLGPDGAALIERDQVTHAEARIDDVINTVGAGDALLAGFLAGGGGRAGLATAVAWSVAACRSPGTQLRHVTRSDFDAVTVHDVALVTRRLAA